MNGELIVAGFLQEDSNRFEVWILKGNTFQRRSSTTLSLGEDRPRVLLVKGDFIIVYLDSEGLVFKNITSGKTNTVKDLQKRTKYGLTYTPALDSYFLFGGTDEMDIFSNDLWHIKNGLATKIVNEEAPSPRASCRLLPTAKGFILYGGVETGGNLSNEMWRYEEGQWEQME